MELLIELRAVMAADLERQGKLGWAEEEFAAVASRNLLGRPVGADAVADAVAYLIGARGVTGQNVFVDCGQRFLARDRDVMFDRARG